MSRRPALAARAAGATAAAAGLAGLLQFAPWLPSPAAAETAEVLLPPPVAPPSRAEGATVARVVMPTMARRRPGAGRGGWLVRPETEWSGRPQQLLVLGSTVRAGRQWLEVLLPVRPNRTSAWMPRQRVVLDRTPYWVDVRTATRRVTVFRAGRRVRAMRAVVGTSGTPTPHGLAAVHEVNRQPDPNAFLGPWVLSLTAHSNVLRSYGGGPGRVGIHGRSGESLQDPLGSARSHGCVRVANSQITWMAKRLPAGTPVDIRG